MPVQCYVHPQIIMYEVVHYLSLIGSRLTNQLGPAITFLNYILVKH